jgi:hypothetical protein
MNRNRKEKEMAHWIIQLILHILNTCDNDTRGFCQWAYTPVLGFWFACG